MNKEFSQYLQRLKNDFHSRFNKKQETLFKLEEFQRIKIIGAGGFGIVYLVLHEPTNSYFAMKSLEKRKIVKYKYIEQSLREKRILEAIRFPFVVHMEHFFKDDTRIYFVMPFINGGDIFSELERCGKFEESKSMFYASQVVLALEYLHNCKLIYRDLKPENIVIDSDGYIKLTDFGFGKLMSKPYAWTTCGTPHYMAPEVILLQGYSFAVDWWCFGILIYEMNAGCLPFDSKSIKKINEKIISGIFTFPTDFSENLKNLLQNLIVVDKTKRMPCTHNGIVHLKNHEWFQTIDWNAILNRKIKAPFIPRLNSKHDTKYFSALEEEIKSIYTSVNKYESTFKEF